MEYLSILIGLVLCLTICILVLGASYIISIQEGDTEKLSPYECGFSPFDDARQKFDVKFYLVGILFIIFDIEVSFLFPWSILELDYVSYIAMLIFLFILTVGFIYEWKKGALDWE